MRNVIIAIVVILLLVPLIPKLMPKKLSIQRIEYGLQAQGFAVGSIEEVKRPENEAAQQWNMTVNGQKTSAFFYTDVGAIAKQHEYHKKDAGTAIVETWNLAQSLGAAPNRNIPEFVARNNMWLFIVRSPDKELGRRIATACGQL
ncbi:MAG TPA: hypothetical protein PLO37_13750 [Candidatus Hydrogenedentes bacterium]|nr:hypothetical protein [Candidatus Hydrogenedentota bacterium]HPG67909.1 hypothetical protein [Candidatus Hydrogenedentota bacterium]